MYSTLRLSDLKSMSPSIKSISFESEQEREGTPLFTWLHLSDLHFGAANTHPDEQRQIFKELEDDLDRLIGHGVPRPDVILVTGDIAFSGNPADYECARPWLSEIATHLELEPTDVFMVPGNHDVLRPCSFEKSQSLHYDLLLNNLDKGETSIDDVLNQSHSEHQKLIRRIAPYLDFSRDFGNGRTLGATSEVQWSFLRPHTVLPVRLIGLNSALLCRGKSDRNRLRFGRKQMIAAQETIREGELVILLSHHPATWLAPNARAHLSW